MAPNLCSSSSHLALAGAHPDLQYSSQGSPEDPVADRRLESIQNPFQSCPREQPLPLIHHNASETPLLQGDKGFSVPFCFLG